MLESDFVLYRDLLKETSGLIITPEKSYLLDTRLTPVAKKWGYETLDEMSVALRKDSDNKLIDDVVDAMTTNETSFFRDTHPFELFKDTILPYLIENRPSNHKIKIWCAACSSGQEPYSLAMILSDKKVELKGRNFEIIATDISVEILNKAKKGVYSQFEVQRGLPIQMLMKHFSQEGESWHLKDQIKNMVTFKELNLLHNFAGLGTVDIILCRNVLIYLDENDKRKILTNITYRMPEDGFLLLGGAETVLNFSNILAPVKDKRGLYKKKEEDSSRPLSNQAIA